MTWLLYAIVASFTGNYGSTGHDHDLYVHESDLKRNSKQSYGNHFPINLFYGCIIPVTLIPVVPQRSFG